MVCPYCNTKTKVTNSRGSKKRSGGVWRRRECTACKAVFSTEEKPVLATVCRLEGPDGLQDLRRGRLFVEILHSLKTADDGTVDTAEALTDNVLASIAHNGQAIITQTQLKKLILAQLRSQDLHAALSYSASNDLGKMNSKKLRELLD